MLHPDVTRTRGQDRREIDPGQAQCPRQVKYRTRSNHSASRLSSQGRGGRLAILAWIVSSAPPLGSMSPTAAESASRSVRSRLFSGVVMLSPA